MSLAALIHSPHSIAHNATPPWLSSLRNAVRVLPKYSRVLVHCTDADHFLISLLTLWQHDCIAVLPPNHQPDTLQSQRQRCVAEIDDNGWQTHHTTHRDTIGDHNSCIELFTSGSSGEAKGIRRSVAQLDAEIAQLEKAFGEKIKSAQQIVATVPFTHIYGLVFRLLWPAVYQRRCQAETHVYPESLFDSIRRESQQGTVVLVSSPAHLERISAHYDVSELRQRMSLCFSSGAPLSRDAALRWAEHTGTAPMEVLGSTETGGIAYRQRSPHDRQEAWTVFDGIHWQLDDDGIMQVQSPAAMTQDWCALGDKAESIDARHFVLLGRADRLIKLEGKRVSLTQMENLLRQHEHVLQAQVCLLPGTRQHLGVVATLNDQGNACLQQQGRRIFSEQLRQHLLQQFERVCLPRYFRFVTHMPVDERGKTTQQLLQQLFENKHVNPA